MKICTVILATLLSISGIMDCDIRKENHLLIVNQNKNAISTGDLPNDFRIFIEKFCSSEEFQLSRVKFPLERWVLVTDPSQIDDTCIENPMTGEYRKKTEVNKSNWKLLEKEVLTPYYSREHSFESKWIKETPTKIYFQGGFIESDITDLYTFKKINGQWYLVDFYN